MNELTEEVVPMDKTSQTELRRNNFKESGLTYADVTMSDIDRLITLINEFGAVHKNMVMKVSRVLKKDFSFSVKGGIIKGYIKVNGPYFDKREAISFNEGGFIGFAGWADKYNVRPFTKAFDTWLGEKLSNKEANNG